MTGHTLLTVWSDSTMLSSLIWLLIALVLLYLARRPAHAALYGTGRSLHRALRLSARSLMRLEARLDRRNREILRANGVDQRERLVEREFHRVGNAVAQDLAHYPALHRGLSEQITRIDEDYRRSTEVPPAPPAWLEAVDAVANIPAKDDPAVNQILEDIHATLERSCHNAVMEYRAASHRRHKLLRRMLPYWRRLRDTLERVDRNIATIEQRSARIDEHMARYEALRHEGGRTDRSLHTSALARFVISTLVLAVAAVAAYVNFTLIARPMEEMIAGAGGPGPAGLAGYPLAAVAGITMVLLQLFLGLFLMELLRVTRLFPAVGAWDERTRRVLAAVLLGTIAVSALVVAALAFQRDYLLAQDMAVTALLVAESAQPPVIAMHWIPALTQMFLGLLLPIVLALVAVPLEAFIHSARSVLGSLAVGTLRLAAYLLRLLGLAADVLAKLLVRFYDLLIFLPLALELGVRNALQRTSTTSTDNAPSTTSSRRDAPVRRSRQPRAQSKTATAAVEGGGEGEDPSSGEAEART